MDITMQWTNENSKQIHVTRTGQAREKACDKTAAAFVLTPDWLGRWREFLNQSQSAIKQN